MAEPILTESDIDTLIRMVFLDEETFSMMKEDGKVEGQIGETHLFTAKPVKDFFTLYRIDVKKMDGTLVEALIFHKHSDKIPKDRPGKAMEVYRLESWLLDDTSNGNSTRRGLTTSYRNPSGNQGIDFKRDNPLKLGLRM